MSQSVSQTMPLKPFNKSTAKSTPKGGSESIRWVSVMLTPGILPAQIIADSLKVEGIPAYARQEAAGSAFGLTVGLLGSGYVLVPEEFEKKARAFLAEMEAMEEE